MRTTQEMVRLCLEKDPLAWEAFVKRFSRLVLWAIERSFARHRFPFRREDLEDTFQQVFSHLWEKGLKGARDIARLEGFLAVVSHRIAVDYVRKEKRRGREWVSLEEAREGREGNRGRGDPPSGGTPREVAEMKWFEERLEDIFGTLSRKESCILRLNVLEEKTHAEISELLKIPIGTVSSLIQRTKEKVKAALKKRSGGTDV